MVVVWLKFISAAFFIFISGKKLSYHADVFAEKKGIGKGWIGLVLLAGITSLPEAFTAISAVGFSKAPDMALGDIFGSNVFNLAIIAVLDYIYRSEKPLISELNQEHLLTIGAGIFLSAVALLGLSSRKAVLNFSFSEISLFICYLVFVRLHFSFGRQTPSPSGEEKYPDLSLESQYWPLLKHSTILVASSLLLADAGKGIVVQTGLPGSFVGFLFLAVATSMPEIVISISSLKLGEVNMALGNILGSNLANLAIIFPASFFQPGSPLITASRSASHATYLVEALFMYGIIILGASYKSSRKVWRIGWDSFLLIAVYFLFLNRPG
ncbi:MAG: sodium:calcium antiporter [bacterium]